jgi:hypothetical protein
VALDDQPMLMFSRLRISRSSTMRPPWTIPMRMMRVFAAEGPLAFDAEAGVWVAMESFPLRLST